ncbi:class II aaRS and biotin synthetase [Exidia glandulosa HHB12029]|uniref:Class II aaRS and biotin synthetase n=1 Tax=Exidia glandulosa HHB12029 TaxID=1314781 RepID=A0A165N7V0_EXIGL|nr:class II aaRS and biotin synthetase [Exidia glandulosa HHB12029]
MNVLVYSGHGVSQTSLAHTLSALRALTTPYLSVRTVTASTLAKQPWASTCALLVIPGGRDLPYVEALSEGKPNANDAIRAYVSKGGKFLGICAGAYYASRRIEWERGREGFEVSGERPLAFFDGTSSGCVYPGFEYQTEHGARIVRLELNRAFGDAGDLCTYYNGGGEFVDAESVPGVEVIARYTDGDGAGKTAAISCRVDQGTALLWACHPEYPLVSEPCTTVLASSPVIAPDHLAAAESRRWTFLRTSLTQLGILGSSGAVSQPDIPRAPLPYIGTASSFLAMECLRAATGVLGTTVVDRHNRVQIHTARSHDEISAFVTDARSNPVPLPAAPPEDNAVKDEDKILAHIVLGDLSDCREESTPCFSIPRFMTALSSARATVGAGFGSWGLGELLFYSEAVESTQTLLDKNPTFCAALPTPLVAIATHQLAGRGRGGNAWVSPRGSMMLSALIRVPLSSLPAHRLALVQYLFSIAVVDACRAVLPDNSQSTVRLKWPNDIYAAPEEGDLYDPKVTRKLGGVLVSTNFRGSDVDVIIGCGLNALNDHPTTSLASLAPSLRETLSIEDLAASVLARFDAIFAQFVAAKGSFEPFLGKYLRYWLHADQEVTLTTTDPPTRVRIVGIHPEHGLLRTMPVDAAPVHSSNPFAAERQFIDLQPDGNSFDMFAGLIRLKS